MPIVIFPGCNWCNRNSVEIYKCRSCRKYSCNDCHLGYNTSDRCEHRKYEPLRSSGWERDANKD